MEHLLKNMECWNNGIMGKHLKNIFFFFKPIIPFAQYSIIPVFKNLPSFLLNC